MSDDIPALIAEGKKVGAYHGPFSMTNRLAKALEAEHARANAAEDAWAKLVSDTLEAAAKVQARIAALEAALTEADKFIDFYFSPWGAAKAEIWESKTNDAPFTAENALRKLKRDLRGQLEKADGN